LSLLGLLLGLPLLLNLGLLLSGSFLGLFDRLLLLGLQALSLLFLRLAGLVGTRVLHGPLLFERLLLG
jgi:hypothetical protein